MSKVFGSLSQVAAPRIRYIILMTSSCVGVCWDSHTQCPRQIRLRINRHQRNRRNYLPTLARSPPSLRSYCADIFTVTFLLRIGRKCQLVRRSICGTNNRRTYILSSVLGTWGVASERESSEITVDYVKKSLLFLIRHGKKSPTI